MKNRLFCHKLFCIKSFNFPGTGEWSGEAIAETDESSINMAENGKRLSQNPGSFSVAPVMEGACVKLFHLMAEFCLVKTAKYGNPYFEISAPSFSDTTLTKRGCQESPKIFCKKWKISFRLRGSSPAPHRGLICPWTPGWFSSFWAFRSFTHGVMFDDFWCA